ERHLVAFALRGSSLLARWGAFVLLVVATATHGSRAGAHSGTDRGLAVGAAPFARRRRCGARPRSRLVRRFNRLVRDGLGCAIDGEDFFALLAANFLALQRIGEVVIVTTPRARYLNRHGSGLLIGKRNTGGTPEFRPVKSWVIGCLY